MTRTDMPNAVPMHLSVPIDDGACNHLLGMFLPAIALPATTGTTVSLHALPGRTVVYCYPRTGRPNQAPPDGWDAIPGARGCTPQACAFRDQYGALLALQTQVFGLSTQATPYQQEAAARLHLPFPLLSDAALIFARALCLPTFTVDGDVLLKRVTLIVANGVIEQVFYPVFPPDQNVQDILAWLHHHP